MGEHYSSYSHTRLLFPTDEVSTVKLINCNEHNIYHRLNYSNGYSDGQGVNITAANFGNMSSVEILDLQNERPYFHSFVEFFVKQRYIRNANIRAAPYDWRLATGT